MSLKGFLSRLLPRSWRSDGPDPISVVLLQKQPHFFTASELRTGGEKAFNVPFEDGEASRHFVVQKEFVTFIKAGSHVISLLHQKTPYLSLGDDELGQFLPDESRREWWKAHKAYCAYDHMNAGTDLKLAYRVLIKFVAEMTDANCCGVYIPGKQIFVPGGHDLYQNLQLLLGTDNTGTEKSST